MSNYRNYLTKENTKGSYIINTDRTDSFVNDKTMYMVANKRVSAWNENCLELKSLKVGDKIKIYDRKNGMCADGTVSSDMKYKANAVFDMAEGYLDVDYASVNLIEE